MLVLTRSRRLDRLSWRRNEERTHHDKYHRDYIKKQVIRYNNHLSFLPEPSSCSGNSKEATRRGNQSAHVWMSERSDCRRSHHLWRTKGSGGEANGNMNAAAADKSDRLWLEGEVIVSDRTHSQDAAERWCLTVAGVKGLLAQHRSPRESDGKET